MGKAFVRVFIKIQGNIHDLWNITDVETAEEYNQNRGELDFILKLIRGRSVNKELVEKRYAFHTRAERDAIVHDINEKISNSHNMAFLGEGDGTDFDDEDDMD